MRRDAPSELASPSLTRASHARADENGGNSVKGTGFRTLQSFAEKDLASEEIGGYNGAYFGSTSYFDDEISAALAGTANTLSTNGGDYSSAVDATREQVRVYRLSQAIWAGKAEYKPKEPRENTMDADLAWFALPVADPGSTIN